MGGYSLCATACVLQPVCTHQEAGQAGGQAQRDTRAWSPFCATASAPLCATAFPPHTPCATAKGALTRKARSMTARAPLCACATACPPPPPCALCYIPGPGSTHQESAVHASQGPPVCYRAPPCALRYSSGSTHQESAVHAGKGRTQAVRIVKVPLDHLHRRVRP